MLRLGVVGHGGRVAGFINSNMRTLEPDLKVVALVDPDRDGALKRLPESDRADAVFYDTVDALLRQDKVDAGMVGTRCDLHTPFGIDICKKVLKNFISVLFY